MKIIDLELLSKGTGKRVSEFLPKVLREVSITKQLRHKNIVQFFDVALQGSKVFMVMELVPGGDLFDLVKSRGRLTEGEARKYFRDLVSALEYCHCNLVIHRDLKLENILLSKDGRQVKLADFGLSNLITPGLPLQTSCGSYQYTAPEVICGESYIGPASDVWSLGICLYAMVTGSLPFGSSGECLAEIAQRALSRDFEISEAISPRKWPAPLLVHGWWAVVIWFALGLVGCHVCFIARLLVSLFQLLVLCAAVSF